MQDMKAGDAVRTLQEIVVIRGLERTTIPAGTAGTVESTVASDAGCVRLHAYGGVLFLKASELEWDHGVEKRDNVLILPGDKPEITTGRHPDGTNDGSIIVWRRPGHAYCIAKAPRYSTDEEWQYNAALLVKGINSIPIGWPPKKRDDGGE